MWFKNCLIYRFSQGFEFSAEEVGQRLRNQSFQPCGPQEEERLGWVPPLGRYGTDLVHAGQGHIMLCARKQVKLLPASVVNELLEERLIDLEEREGRSTSRKQRKDMKEELIFDLMPKAFTRSNLIYGYISLQDQLLVINSSATNRAEEFINLLRETLGTLALEPVQCLAPLVERMTQWVSGKISMPAGWQLGESCELRDRADEKSIIRCRNQDLQSAEIGAHIQSGMEVSKLALNWQEKVSFMLDDKLALKQISFEELVTDQAGDAQDPAEQFDRDFALMTLELGQLFKALTSALDGIKSG